MLSYWEHTELIQHDIIIVGGGIVGLSIAASIKERFPNREVSVFERSFIPYGASTRNAGFACFGSLTEVLADIESMGADTTRELIFSRWLGLQITRKRLSDADIEFHDYGGFEIIDENSMDVEKEITVINELCSDFQADYLSLVSSSDTALNLKRGQALVSMSGEGQLNTGLLMRKLVRYCQQLEVQIFTGTEISGINKQNDAYQFSVNDRDRGGVECLANTVITAVNGFANELTEENDIAPARGQVLVTEPIEDWRFKGNLHLDEGYYYLRNIGSRLLFGGGRNLDFDGEETTEFGLTSLIQNTLESKILDLFSFPKAPKIDYRWSGVMGFGIQKTPVIKIDSSGIIIAAGMGGMGIALAGFMGEQVADIIESNKR